MAGEGDLGGSAKKSFEDIEDDLPLFNAENLQNNIKSVYYSRTFLSIVGGVVAGIWGFTGLAGFVFISWSWLLLLWVLQLKQNSLFRHTLILGTGYCLMEFLVASCHSCSSGHLPMTLFTYFKKRRG